jgi:DNA mismatch repair protein MutL
MSVINILSPHVADLIAAGEVVERPASVVKELCENAIDAGAKNVTVEIRGGGAAYIRVTDDGCGMSPEDAGVAFLRHATSKLRDARGLEAIGTLGFRGEALAAISAVSRVELTTREKGAEAGTFVSLEAGDIQEMRPAGCPEGTTLLVRDLFFNTPARFKFLKSDRAEAQNCVALALKTALAHPEISVKCVRDGQEQFFSPGDGRVDSCVYSLLGRETAQGFLKAESEVEGVRVSGYVSSPRAGRGNRGAQFFFCNGRPIRSLTLQTALEQAYKNSLMVGRFPACVLYVTLSCAAVDVNVHPTKSEVKFSDEHRVFDAVYHAALGALEQENALSAQPKEASAPRVTRESEPPKRDSLGRGDPSGKRPAAGAPREDFFRQMRAEDFREALKTGLGAAAPSSAVRTGGMLPIAEPEIPYRQREQKGIRVQRVEPPKPEEEPVPAAPETPEFRLVGEAFACYIVVEQGDDLIFIDKHAAHERILFDRLKAQKREPMRQMLLVPVTLSPGAGDTELLLENAPLLEKLGFELEAFGSDSVVLRAVPAETDCADARAMLEEILEKLRRADSPDPDAALDEVLHTVACKAAIKAGKDSSPEELKALAARVLSGEVRYCPHGRPLSVTRPKKELDKLFGRLG